MHTNAHCPSWPDTPCRPQLTAEEGPNPTVSASFMTRIMGDDDPWSPYGTTFNSNWPICDRKLVFHLSKARTRNW
jgi:hypothetical protein